ncbi:beta-glucosidase [Glutamicibacter halophytocola]|uniref:Glycoside hydrolase family 3 C-terminal domain-containing protein n=1 Tax=Glutamicibacter halophytocola TaxID=1933880 RepID=A0AA94XX84_9MICC|nr:glycoside hydrolase family 3 C-terminal domain-containing protein [Glutamicibacter halophytocola]UUX60279.1 glycoside hydrolase family 3 C-terminal domain-containing protein [Glutamicibacter halophytocola]
MTLKTHSSQDLLNTYRPLIDKLSLPEKVRLLSGETAFTLPGNESIGLAEMAFSDGPTGVRGLKFYGDPVALFPNATLVSGSWDDDIAREVGVLLSEEAARQKIHVVLGPTINLHRTPLGGRLFEAYSEDPYLTGRTAANYVNGMQASGTGACLKHLVANESEEMRNFMSSSLSETALREVYLTPFEIAVQDAHPYSMMAAYNDVNGVPATEQDHVQNQIVKGEWDWDGLIMSDWYATKHTSESANGGLDLVMPGGDGPWGEHLVEAVNRGEVAESTIDEHLARLLLLAERTGALSSDRSQLRTFEQQMPSPTDPARAEQLKRIASRGMVLLKNESDLLPLDSGTVALSGHHALATQNMGGGSAQVTPPYQVSIADGLGALLGSRLAVADGPWPRRRPLAVDPESVTDPGTGTAGMEVTYFAQDGSVIKKFHSDLAEITVGWDDDGSQIPARLRIRAKLSDTMETARLGAMGAGRWTLEYQDAQGTVVSLDRSCEFVTNDPGEAILRPPAFEQICKVAAGSVVTATVDLVDTDWSARLLEDPRYNMVAESHMAGFDSFGKFALVATDVPVDENQLIAAAAQAAGQADTAVVVVGLTEEDETEAADKTTLRLPGEQDELVRQVAAAAKRTVVVVNAATPVLMPWLEQVDAVLVVGLPGQEGGHAVAEVLTGVAEPTGRLVTSYPAEDAASPAWSTSVDGDLALCYSEGSFIGYRGYAASMAPAPLFWFGHGLGYATWEYHGAQREGDQVRVELTNTGRRSSRETVQLYFQPDDVSQPVRLVGYQGIQVGPGAKASVSVEIDPRMMRAWDEEAGNFVELGGGTFLLARSLGDVRLSIRS